MQIFAWVRGGLRVVESCASNDLDAQRAEARTTRTVLVRGSDEQHLLEEVGFKRGVRRRLAERQVMRGVLREGCRPDSHGVSI